MEGNDKYEALRQLLKEKCAGSNFSDDDVKNLVEAGFETEADLKAITLETLTKTLLGRASKVAILLRKFSSITVDRNLVKEVAQELASQMSKKHKTAYTDSIPVDEVEITLWRNEARLSCG